MSLKSIRESYSKLLAVFNDAGVKLSESQKSDLDTFVLAIESNMSRQRETAIRQTKEAVERKMEKEYREMFEGVMSAMQENAELASKIQEKVARIDESRKTSEKVNDYLELYVESVLPKKTIVDYDRMQKLERIHESLKDALLVTEDAVEAKKAQLEESFKVQKSKCETEVAKLQVRLNESMEQAQELKRKVDGFKAQELLESKTKDLPAFEARKMKKRLAEASAPEIEKKFDEELGKVRKDAEKVVEGEELAIEDEIQKILEADDGAEVKEDDMIKDRPHNAHVPAKEVDEKKEEPAKADEEIFETMEQIRYNEEGDIELDESDVIDDDLMKLWCNQSVEVN